MPNAIYERVTSAPNETGGSRANQSIGAFLRTKAKYATPPVTPLPEPPAWWSAPSPPAFQSAPPLAPCAHPRAPALPPVPLAPAPKWRFPPRRRRRALLQGPAPPTPRIDKNPPLRSPSPSAPPTSDPPRTPPPRAASSRTPAEPPRPGHPPATPRAPADSPRISPVWDRAAS